MKMNQKVLQILYVYLYSDCFSAHSQWTRHKKFIIHAVYIVTINFYVTYEK
jgi:hypothetical protein